MKKTTNSNPLKFFNDAKEARNKSFSKSLPKKGEGGRTMGPMTQQEAAAAETAATSYPGPYAIPSVKDQLIKSMGTRPSFTDTNSYLKNNTERVNNNNIEYEKGLNSGAMQARSKDLDTYKRPVRTQQQQLMEQERMNRINTTPKTGIPVPPEYKPNEDPNYLNSRQGKNGGMMKKGGTHKMPNGKVMLNSKMKKKTSKKK